MIRLLILTALFSLNLIAASSEAYYTNGPYIVNSNLTIKTDLATPYKLCIGYAVNEKGGEGPVACKPYDAPKYGGGFAIVCPSAQECIDDKTVSMEKAEVLD